MTTGRRLAEEPSTRHDNVVVVLDGDCAFKTLTDEEFDIYWGAYLGMAEEMLFRGPLRELSGRIEQARAEARARKGWIMDTYPLRKRRTRP